MEVSLATRDLETSRVFIFKKQKTVLRKTILREIIQGSVGFTLH